AATGTFPRVVPSGAEEARPPSDLDEAIANNRNRASMWYRRVLCMNHSSQQRRRRSQMRKAKSILGSIITTTMVLVAGCGGPADGGFASGSDPALGVSEQAVSMTMLGADVSSVQRSLDLGASYYDGAGTKKDPLDILKAQGVNYIRLRVWNNPASGYNN